MKSVPLAHAAQVDLGRQRSPENHDGPNMVPYLRSANVNDGALDLSDVKRMNFTPDEQRRFSLRTGDVLVTEGSGSRETVGTSAVWRGSAREVVCFQNTLLRLRPRDSTCEGRFLGWWARHAHATGMMAAAANGANILHLGAEGLRALPITLPPLEVQRRIADFLDDQVARIDRAIQLRQRQAELIASRHRAFLAASYFDSATPSTRLGRVATIKHGRQRSPEHETGDHMTRYVRSANVSDGQVDVSDLKEMNFTPAERRVYALLPGDVLLTEASGSPAAIGASAAWEGQASGVVCFQNHLLRLRARPGQVTAEYLLWWARASFAAGAMEVWATGANILNLGSDIVSKMPIPIRGAADQSRIAARCREGDNWMDEFRRDLTAVKSLLLERKRSLITAAVTGEFDVSSASPRSADVVITGVGVSCLGM